MRKLEAVTREIVDELGYLQRREMKMRDTNGQSTFSPDQAGMLRRECREHEQQS